MAFIIAITPSYKVKVIVEMPNEAGRIEKSDFMAQFKRVSMDDLDELRKRPQKEVLEEVLIGWTGLLDENKESVPFNQATLASVLAIPQAFSALADSFWGSIFKAKEKN